MPTSLTLATASYTTRLFDLATVLGVTLIGGIAGAGLNPKGKSASPGPGLLGLFVGTLTRSSLTPLSVASIVGAGGAAFVSGNLA